MLRTIIATDIDGGTIGEISLGTDARNAYLGPSDLLGDPRKLHLLDADQFSLETNYSNTTTRVENYKMFSPKNYRYNNKYLRAKTFLANSSSTIGTPPLVPQPNTENAFNSTDRTEIDTNIKQASSGGYLQPILLGENFDNDNKAVSITVNNKHEICINGTSIHLICCQDDDNEANATRFIIVTRDGEDVKINTSNYVSINGNPNSSSSVFGPARSMRQLDQDGFHVGYKFVEGNKYKPVDHDGDEGGLGYVYSETESANPVSGLHFIGNSIASPDRWYPPESSNLSYDYFMSMDGCLGHYISGTLVNRGILYFKNQSALTLKFTQPTYRIHTYSAKTKISINNYNLTVQTPGSSSFIDPAPGTGTNKNITDLVNSGLLQKIGNTDLTKFQGDGNCPKYISYLDSNSGNLDRSIGLSIGTGVVNYMDSDGRGYYISDFDYQGTHLSNFYMSFQVQFPECYQPYGGGANQWRSTIAGNADANFNITTYPSRMGEGGYTDNTKYDNIFGHSPLVYHIHHESVVTLPPGYGSTTEKTVSGFGHNTVRTETSSVGNSLNFYERYNTYYDLNQDITQYVYSEEAGRGYLDLYVKYKSVSRFAYAIYVVNARGGGTEIAAGYPLLCKPWQFGGYGGYRDITFVNVNDIPVQYRYKYNGSTSNGTFVDAHKNFTIQLIIYGNSTSAPSSRLFELEFDNGAYYSNNF